MRKIILSLILYLFLLYSNAETVDNNQTSFKFKIYFSILNIKDSVVIIDSVKNISNSSQEAKFPISRTLEKPEYSSKENRLYWFAEGDLGEPVYSVSGKKWMLKSQETIFDESTVKFDTAGVYRITYEFKNRIALQRYFFVFDDTYIWINKLIQMYTTGDWNKLRGDPEPGEKLPKTPKLLGYCELNESKNASDAQDFKVFNKQVDVYLKNIFNLSFYDTTFEKGNQFFEKNIQEIINLTATDTGRSALRYAPRSYYETLNRIYVQRAIFCSHFKQNDMSKKYYKIAHFYSVLCHMLRTNDHISRGYNNDEKSVLANFNYIKKTVEDDRSIDSVNKDGKRFWWDKEGHEAEEKKLRQMKE